MDTLADRFTAQTLLDIFPQERSNDFFEALFGDAEEGAFDIRLAYDRYEQNDQTLHFKLELHERPGRCLACNLTYGLPDVFARHPVINLAGLVKDIDQLLSPDLSCEEWKLGTTQQQQGCHCIPLVIALRPQ
ncbi:pancreas/duodenum homeobox protein 1 [Desulfogranum mediterraneum]|uniref:pancreas/duodenum homeobox protein 1 n=1 Tax=Desulfogranum mediterraneum TaxID=160661 RepID=UPI00040F7300|nr:pancreas/duodenum homeobox protein 1 [Desulfogranum mediterraneum]